MKYLTANKKHPFMGLDNKTCKNPMYWCRLHQVWLSEEDVRRKRCMDKPTFDMIGAHRCQSLEKKTGRRGWAMNITVPE